MPITIAGSGTITGISAGGLPDASIVADDLASNAVTTAKISDANITAAKLDGAQSGSAPIYGARAWVNFNGTGVVAIRASGNVSSITDNGTGDYTVNFTTAMPDANYAVTSMGTDGGSSNSGLVVSFTTAGVNSTSNVRVQTVFTSSASNSRVDFTTVALSVFR